MRFKLDEHTAEVLRKSIPSVFVKIIGVISSMLLSVFLARELGAEGIGIIGLSTRIVTIVIVVGLFGTRPIIIKEIAIAKSNGSLQRVGDIMKSALFLNGGITFILSILMIFIAPWMSETVFNEPDLTFPLMISLVAITPQVLSRIYSAGLTGSKKICQSSLVDNSLSILISIILLLFARLAGLEINIINVAIIYAIGRIFVTMTVMFYWRYITRENKTKASIGKMNMFNRSYLVIGQKIK